MRSFKSNENIHKKEDGSYYVVSANKASSVTLQSSGNESQKKYIAILRTLSCRPVSFSEVKIAHYQEVGWFKIYNMLH